MPVKDTSIAALHTVDAAAIRAQVLGLLQRHPLGLTDDQGGDLLWPKERDRRLKFGRRRCELVEMGLVEDFGKRDRNKNGRKVVVWRYVPPERRAQPVVLSDAERARQELVDSLKRMTKDELAGQLADKLLAFA